MGEVNLIRVSPDELLIIHANGDGTAILEHFQRRDAVKLPAEAVAALSAKSEKSGDEESG